MKVFPELSTKQTQVPNWLSALVLIGCALLAFRVWDINRRGPQPRVSPVRSHHRTLATALESYWVDHALYPPSSRNIQKTPMRDLAGKHPSANWDVPTFMHHLTTPTAYLRALTSDEWATEPGRSYGYYLHPSGKGWIVWSPGPNRTYNLDWTVYDPEVSQPSRELITGAGPEGAYTYDPTNGTVSPGDIWRVKQ